MFKEHSCLSIIGAINAADCRLRWPILAPLWFITSIALLSYSLSGWRCKMTSSDSHTCPINREKHAKNLIMLCWIGEIPCTRRSGEGGLCYMGAPEITLGVPPKLNYETCTKLKKLPLQDKSISTNYPVGTDFPIYNTISIQCSNMHAV